MKICCGFRNLEKKKMLKKHLPVKKLNNERKKDRSDSGVGLVQDNHNVEPKKYSFCL